MQPLYLASVGRPFGKDSSLALPDTYEWEFVEFNRWVGPAEAIASLQVEFRDAVASAVWLCDAPRGPAIVAYRGAVGAPEVGLIFKDQASLKWLQETARRLTYAYRQGKHNVVPYKVYLETGERKPYVSGQPESD